MANFFPPTVTGIDQSVDIGRSLTADSLFDYFDFDGNPADRYRFFDGGFGGETGYFTVRGVQQNALQWFEVAASDLGTVRYYAGSEVQNETLNILARDGLNWSEPGVARIQTEEPNFLPPTVETNDVSVLGSEVIVGSTMFLASDPDGDEVVRYRVRDQKRNGNSGAFWLNNVKQKQGDWFEFTAAELSTLRYIGGRNAQTEKFIVRASDGEKWSRGVSGLVETTANRFKPVLEVVDRQMKVDTIVDAASWVVWSDADGNTLKEYSFFDTGLLADGGFFSLNGVRQASQEWFTVKVRDVEAGLVQYHAGSVLDSERVRVKVHDGRYSSLVNTFRVDSVEAAEVETAFGTQLLNDSEVLNVSNWVTQTDLGPSIQTWQVFDSSTAKDRFGNELTGSLLGDDGKALAPQRIREYTAAEFADLEFKSGVADRGIEYDEVFIRGTTGSGDWTPWERVNVTSTFNVPRALLNAGGTAGKWGAPVPGTGVTLTYSFMEDVPAHWIGCDEADGMEPLPPAIRQAYRNVLQDYSNTFNINFVEVSDTVPANFEFGMDRLGDDGLIAQARFPGVAVLCGTIPVYGYPTANVGVPAGDNWLNADFTYGDGFSWFDEGAVDFGSDLYNTLLHELGHSLGLHHSFEQVPGDNDNIRPQVENGDWTMMSYNRPTSWKGNAGGSEFDPFSGANITPQLFDHLALSTLYGYNTEFNKEDTVYRYKANEHAQYSETIHDPGGKDRLNFFNYTADSNIDLREGRHSSLAGGTNNFNIAWGTTIEEAVGGSGNDTITGNEVDNRLIGGDGDDTITGMGGRDVAMGQEGNDTYRYSMGDGTLIINEQGGGGRETIELSSFSDNFDSFKQDLSFRVLNGRDLIIALTIDGERSEGNITIRNAHQGASRVETLKMFNNTGDQVGQDMSISSIFRQATNKLQRFERTDFQDQFGYIAIPS
jgi:hypothetical protein